MYTAYGFICLLIGEIKIGDIFRFGVMFNIGAQRVVNSSVSPTTRANR